MKGLQQRIETAAVSFAEHQAPGTGTLLRRALHVVITSQISRMAAALSYRTVFGLIPVLAIGVAFLGGFATDKQVEDLVLKVLDFTGLARIVVTPEAVEGIDPTLAMEAPAGPAAPEDLSKAAELDEWLKVLVAKVRGVSFVAIGLTGLLMLIYAAISFMVEIERAANTIYHAPTGRSWVRRITQYWTTLTLGTLFLVGTFYIGGRFTDSVKSLTTTQNQQEKDPNDVTPDDDPGALDSPAVELLTEESADSDAAGEEPGPQELAAGAGTAGAEGSEPDPPLVEQSQEGSVDPEALPSASADSQADPAGEQKATKDPFLVAAASVAVSLVIGFLLLLFLYMTIPNARVSVQCAAIGAAFAAIMWEAGKQGFTLFVVHSAAQKLYGAIALIPLFLLWVYITWIIILFGLQISYVLQNFRTFAIPEEKDRGPVIVDSLTLLRLMAVIADRFAAGKTVSVAEAAKAICADERTTLTMLERLTEAGLVHRVPVGQEHEGFSLARPASEISARELLELTGRMAGESAGPDEPERLVELRRAQLETAGGLTLADLLKPASLPEGATRAAPRTEPRPVPAG